jgi:hypothetical protein
MRILYFAIVSMVLALTGCSSITEHGHYSYEAPQTSDGKRCVTRCSQGRNSCLDICVMKHPDCFAHAMRAGEQKFAAYQNEQLQKGLPVKKHLKDFVDTRSCKYLCHCVSAYNFCYSSCGGRVS